MFDWLKNRRRKKIRHIPFPEEWCAHIERNVPYYKMLRPKEQAELKGHIQVFLAEKRFEGVHGVEITNEIRVTIAAQACILLLNRKTDYYPALDTIIVYPQAYMATVKRRGPTGALEERREVRLGESWRRGEVVLSWDDVKKGAADVQDGHNLVFHEFAHQLDGEDGVVDGAPKLDKRSHYIAWARVLGEEYKKLSMRIEGRCPAFIRPYATKNPQEFFAVVTEVFFEMPDKLSHCHPELYEQLNIFYKQDPVERYR